MTPQSAAAPVDGPADAVEKREARSLRLVPDFTDGGLTQEDLAGSELERVENMVDVGKVNLLRRSYADALVVVSQSREMVYQRPSAHAPSGNTKAEKKRARRARNMSSFVNGMSRTLGIFAPTTKSATVESNLDRALDRIERAIENAETRGSG